MDKVWKEKWLVALRSGDYAQTRYQLRSGRNTNEYCCLGVLCDIVDPEGWIRVGGLGLGSTFRHTDHEGVPSLNVDQTVIAPNSWRSVIDMNDHGKSFEEIADYIEEMY